MIQARGNRAYERDGYGVFRQRKSKCGCCEILTCWVCGVRQNVYVFSLYCNPDLEDWIFYFLLTFTADMQGEDVHAPFLFVGDLNCHY